ncbi:MAG: hypothetical protein Q4C30_09475 [Bacteroidia bacterium]|nr:hypothetical protein [Bacteroidia bacterium]
MKKRNDHPLGMAWIGQRAAAKWDAHNNNKELETALSIAQEMEIQDKDALTIKMATGWERGADMEWRYEVPDFFWKQKILNQAYSYGSATPFSALVKDERLLTMYPELADYKLFVKLLPPGATTLGYFDESNKLLVVPIINGDDKYDLESVLIHETQHFIQRIEGFERGSNPQAAGGWTNYQRTSGEVEARNAQNRRHLKPDERRKSLWSDTTEPEHANPDRHLFPTKESSRKKHLEDLAKAKEGARTKGPDKAKRKRKQMQLALAVEIALQMDKKRAPQKPTEPSAPKATPKADEHPVDPAEPKSIQMAYRVPDWEHDGDTDSARNELREMGADIVKVHKDRFDDPDYADDDEEAYEVTIIFNCRPSEQKKFEHYGAYKLKDLVDWIYLKIDYLDKDFPTAKKMFPKRVIFGDFYAEGQRRGAEYMWVKTTHTEAAKILPNYKHYIDKPGRWDGEAVENL